MPSQRKWLAHGPKHSCPVPSRLFQSGARCTQIHAKSNGYWLRGRSPEHNNIAGQVRQRQTGYRQTGSTQTGWDRKNRIDRQRPTLANYHTWSPWTAVRRTFSSQHWDWAAEDCSEQEHAHVLHTSSVDGSVHVRQGWKAFIETCQNIDFTKCIIISTTKCCYKYRARRGLAMLASYSDRKCYDLSVMFGLFRSPVYTFFKDL